MRALDLHYHILFCSVLEACSFLIGDRGKVNSVIRGGVGESLDSVKEEETMVRKYYITEKLILIKNI